MAEPGGAGQDDAPPSGVAGAAAEAESALAAATTEHHFTLKETLQALEKRPRGELVAEEYRRDVEGELGDEGLEGTLVEFVQAGLIEFADKDEPRWARAAVVRADAADGRDGRWLTHGEFRAKYGADAEAEWRRAAPYGRADAQLAAGAWEVRWKTMMGGAGRAGCQVARPRGDAKGEWLRVIPFTASELRRFGFGGEALRRIDAMIAAAGNAEHKDGEADGEENNAQAGEAKHRDKRKAKDAKDKQDVQNLRSFFAPKMEAGGAAKEEADDAVKQEPLPAAVGDGGDGEEEVRARTYDLGGFHDDEECGFGQDSNPYAPEKMPGGVMFDAMTESLRTRTDGYFWETDDPEKPFLVKYGTVPWRQWAYPKESSPEEMMDRIDKAWFGRSNRINMEWDEVGGREIMCFTNEGRLRDAFYGSAGEVPAGIVPVWPPGEPVPVAPGFEYADADDESDGGSEEPSDGESCGDEDGSARSSESESDEVSGVDTSSSDDEVFFDGRAGKAARKAASTEMEAFGFRNHMYEESELKRHAAMNADAQLGKEECNQWMSVIVERDISIPSAEISYRELYEPFMKGTCPDGAWMEADGMPMPSDEPIFSDKSPAAAAAQPARDDDVWWKAADRRDLARLAHCSNAPAQAVATEFREKHTKTYSRSLVERKLREIADCGGRDGMTWTVKDSIMEELQIHHELQDRPAPEPRPAAAAAAAGAGGGAKRRRRIEATGQKRGSDGESVQSKRVVAGALEKAQAFERMFKVEVKAAGAEAAGAAAAAGTTPEQQGTAARAEALAAAPVKPPALAPAAPAAAAAAAAREVVELSDSDDGQNKFTSAIKNPEASRPKGPAGHSKCRGTGCNECDPDWSFRISCKARGWERRTSPPRPKAALRTLPPPSAEED